MRVISWFVAATFAAALNGCAALPSAPSEEVRRALAPTGTLRVGFLANTPSHAIRDAASGELKGPAIDLGREVARRIGVPFEPVPYTSFPSVLAGARTAEWDIAMMGVSIDRATVVDFSSPYMIVGFAYLVPAQSSIASANDVDRPGVRVATLEKSSPDAHLARLLRNASLVRVAALPDIAMSVHAGKADTGYGTVAGMLAQSQKVPGSRVIEDTGGEETAIAVPKGRVQAATYVGAIVEAMKRDGTVKAAIERAGLRGVAVAPAR